MQYHVGVDHSALWVVGGEGRGLMSETTGGRRGISSDIISAESALAAGTYFTINEAAIQTREGKAGEDDHT